MRNSVTSSLVISLLVVIGCGRQTMDEHAKANSINEIVAAYTAAQGDGQYARHLKSMLPAALVNLPADQLMLRDLARNQKQAKPTETSHELKEVDAEELRKLSQYFDFPVTPTHFLEFTTVRQDGATKLTNVSPLYLTKNGEGWNVVVGVLKSQGEIEKSYENERLTFNEDDGLWKQHWELQFDKQSNYDYEIVLQQPGSAEPEQVVLAKDEVKFPEDRKIIRFHLLPEGSEQAFEQSSNGGYSLPYAFQAGRRSMSASVHLPMEEISVYEPNREPKFEDDTIILARFLTNNEAGSKEYALLMKRSSKQ